LYQDVFHLDSPQSQVILDVKLGDHVFLTLFLVYTSESFFVFSQIIKKETQEQDSKKTLLFTLEDFIYKESFNVRNNIAPIPKKII